MLAENDPRKPCQVTLTRIQKSNFSIVPTDEPNTLRLKKKVGVFARIYGILRDEHRGNLKCGALPDFLPFFSCGILIL